MAFVDYFSHPLFSTREQTGALEQHLPALDRALCAPSASVGSVPAWWLSC